MSAVPLMPAVDTAAGRSLDGRSGGDRVLGSCGQSLAELAADGTDYKAEIAKAAAQPDKLALARRLATRRLARGVIPELHACSAALELHRLPSCLQATPTA